ncbi:hypothetical protein [Pseudorhodoplanes sp.]|uniref:hypothetical protein n=1 Tax=Pseudorhodoplanes sp. TaxID=1934341 RepID=UPI002CE0C16A|nr:hypothetical protein [Pseudorhodoplanes sp.]HWV51193.1 hypothetical protein [Pseudorhodoplanes sp.]
MFSLPFHRHVFNRQLSAPPDLRYHHIKLPKKDFYVYTGATGAVGGGVAAPLHNPGQIEVALVWRGGRKLIVPTN